MRYQDAAMSKIHRQFDWLPTKLLPNLLAAGKDEDARQGEDGMDAYEKLLDEGRSPIEVLCRAATRRAPGDPFFSATAKLLTRSGYKVDRNTVKRWHESGWSVNPKAWSTLVDSLPPSHLRERLAGIGAAR